MEYNKVNWRMKSDGLTREGGSSSNGLLTNTVYQDSVTAGPDRCHQLPIQLSGLSK
jgi:hypothetical protein